MMTNRGIARQLAATYYDFGVFRNKNQLADMVEQALVDRVEECAEICDGWIPMQFSAEDRGPARCGATSCARLIRKLNEEST